MSEDLLLPCQIDGLERAALKRRINFKVLRIVPFKFALCVKSFSYRILKFNVQIGRFEHKGN